MRLLILFAVFCSFVSLKAHSQALVAHYDVTDATTVTVNGSNEVTQLNDKSGNGYNLTKNGTNVYHPVNGSAFPYITFPNFDSQLKINAITSEDQPLTLYLVVRQNAFDENAFLVKFNDLHYPGTGVRQTEYISGGVSIKSVVPEAESNPNDFRNKLPNLYCPTNTNCNTWKLLKFVFNNTQSYETVNSGGRLLSFLFPPSDGDNPSTFAFTPGDDPFVYISVGGAGVSGEHANFDFAEMRIYRNSGLSEAQALTIEQSLMVKYGILPISGIKGFGDSNTVGLLLPDQYTQNWLFLTAKALNKAYYNYGINQSRLYDPTDPNPNSKFNRSGLLNTRNLGQYGTEDYCFFMFGTNDDFIDAAWRDHYKTYLQESFINKGYNKTHLILVVPPNRGTYSKLEDIKNYLDQVAASVGFEGVQIADLYHYLLSLPGPIDNYFNDGIHINQLGHQKASEFLRAFIEPTALPVSFNLFNSACTNTSVKLTWKTAQETNSKRFDVERSSDGSTWQVIGSVSATGVSNSEKTYTFSDNNPSSDFLYRIVEVSTDNRKVYTTTIRSSCSKSKELFSAFPNPVDDFTTVSITSAEQGPLELKLYDSKGALIKLYKKQILRGVNQFQVNVSGLAKGIYLLNATWNNSSKMIKVIK